LKNISRKSSDNIDTVNNNAKIIMKIFKDANNGDTSVCHKTYYYHKVARMIDITRGSDIYYDRHCSWHFSLQLIPGAFFLMAAIVATFILFILDSKNINLKYLFVIDMIGVCGFFQIMCICAELMYSVIRDYDKQYNDIVKVDYSPESIA